MSGCLTEMIGESKQKLDKLNNSKTDLKFYKMLFFGNKKIPNTVTKIDCTDIIAKTKIFFKKM